MSDETKPRVLTYAIGGLAALAFGVLLVYLFNPRWFGGFIHFDGRIKVLRALEDERLFVVERVETGGGEDGPTTVGDRWRIVDATTGKTTVGPFYVDPTYWIDLRGGRVIAMHTRELVIHGLDNKRLATLDSFTGVGSLQRDASSMVVSDDGTITAMSDDGRFYVLDVEKLTATVVARRPSPGRHDSLHKGRISGFELIGSPRAQVRGKGPDYLDAAWLLDPTSGDPFTSGSAHVLLHHQRVPGARGGPGPMLSLVDDQGAERWRFVSPLETISGVVLRGDTLVVGVGPGQDDRGAFLIALGIADGKARWRIAL